MQRQQPHCLAHLVTRVALATPPSQCACGVDEAQQVIGVEDKQAACPAAARGTSQCSSGEQRPPQRVLGRAVSLVQRCVRVRNRKASAPAICKGGFR